MKKRIIIVTGIGGFILATLVMRLYHQELDLNILNQKSIFNIWRAFLSSHWRGAIIALFCYVIGHLCGYIHGREEQKAPPLKDSELP